MNQNARFTIKLNMSRLFLFDLMKIDNLMKEQMQKCLKYIKTLSDMSCFSQFVNKHACNDSLHELSCDQHLLKRMFDVKLSQSED